MKTLFNKLALLALLIPGLAFAGFSGGGGGGGGAPAPVVVFTNLYALPAYATYTAPTGTNIIVNTGAGTNYVLSIALPASPVENQTFEVDSSNAWFQSITFTGGTILGVNPIGLMNWTKVEFVFDTTNGWVQKEFTNLSPAPNSPSLYMGKASGYHDGWQFLNNSTSTAYGFVYNTMQILSTNSQANQAIGIVFEAISTLDVSSTVAGYSPYSYAGFYSTTPNSHLGQGAGSTNDDQVEAMLATTNAAFVGGANLPPNYTGAPAGAATWFVHRNSQLYFARSAGYAAPSGTGAGGMDGVIDLSGNLDWKNILSVNGKPVITTNDTRAGQVAASITVGATPYHYTAVTGGSVAISGGTVSNLTLTRGGTTVWNTTLSSDVVPVRAGDVVIVTYAVVPTMFFLGN